jgi:hypothetical protein
MDHETRMCQSRRHSEYNGPDQRQRWRLAAHRLAILLCIAVSEAALPDRGRLWGSHEQCSVAAQQQRKTQRCASAGASPCTSPSAPGI